MTQLSGVEALSHRTWNFCNGDGFVHSRDFEFRDASTIGGYNHPNERRWRGEDGAIVLTRGDGTISPVVKPQAPNPLGEEVYCSEFCFAPPGQVVIPILKRLLGGPASALPHPTHTCTEHRKGRHA